MQTHVVWLKTGVSREREKAKRSVWRACELCDVKGYLNSKPLRSNGTAIGEESKYRQRHTCTHALQEPKASLHTQVGLFRV